MDTPTGDGSYERVYPEAEVASHIVGWASGSGEGGEATGLERSLDDLLAGAAGYRWVTLDASGNPLFVDEARGMVCDPLEEGP